VIDDIVDFFTFISMMLFWRMGWLPGPDALWVILVMMASLFGFSNATAKQEGEGFFLGFPSYWNVVAFYTGLFVAEYGAAGAYFSLGSTLVLALMTILPVRFIYPNQAPDPWQWPVIVGAVICLGMMLAMLPTFPSVPAWEGRVVPLGQPCLPVILLRPVFLPGPGRLPCRVVTGFGLGR